MPVPKGHAFRRRDEPSSWTRHYRPGYERDDPPDVIEAKFQAALKEVKRSRRLSGDVTWPSSLARVVRQVI